MIQWFIPKLGSPGTLAFLICFAAVGFGLIIAGYRTHEKSHRAEHIQMELDALKVRQVNLKDQFDKLAADSAKAPNDPTILKELGARHLKLVDQENTLKTDLDRVQKELDANK